MSQTLKEEILKTLNRTIKTIELADEQILNRSRFIVLKIMEIDQKIVSELYKKREEMCQKQEVEGKS